jgi:hypothetical protein
MKYFSALFVALCVLALPTSGHAEVLATFYSHDMKDNYFPHAFIRLKGTIEATGEMVDTNYGFTAQKVSPALLMGSVLGMMETKDAKYISKSDAHFTLKLADADYQKLMAHVEKWRSMPGKSYNLGKQNCVHFVMEAAAMFGLAVNRKSKYFKKPKSFLMEVLKLNPGLSR